MPRITLRSLNERRANNQRFACLTAYDASFARSICKAGIEVILVGDSLGMVCQGHDSTLPVTVDDISRHTASVVRGCSGQEHQPLIMADMPFMGAATLDTALENSARLMRSGAHMVKLEGGEMHCEAIRRLADNGIPVCAHLGLTPQSVHRFSGFRVQGRQQEAAQRILHDADALTEAGATIILLECVPAPLTQRVHEKVSVPTIGIGAGPATNGQILVMHDLLGIDSGHRKPRFVKNFLQDADSIESAFSNYASAVRNGEFPGPEHCFEQ